MGESVMNLFRFFEMCELETPTFWYLKNAGLWDNQTRVMFVS